MTTSASVPDLLEPVLNDLATILSHVGPDQASAPTPCTDYDVGALRDHVVAWLATFAAGYADPEGQAPPLEAFTPSGDFAGDVRAAAARLLGAVRSGAAGRPLRLGSDAMPGDMALDMILWEYQVHGWDLARATGQPWSPPDAAAERSLQFAPGMLTDAYQGPGKAFGPRVPVPETAGALERLVGLSGRDPDWRPPSPAS